MEVSGCDSSETVRAIWDKGDARLGGQALKQAVDSGVQVWEAARAESAEVIRRDSGSVEEQLMSEANECELLKLPLVGNYGCIGDLAEVLFVAREAAELLRELGRANAFGALT